MERRSEHRREALAACALWLGIVAGLAYVAQRTIEHLGGPVGDELAYIRSPHVAFYWRCATASFWGGLAAIVVRLLVTRGVAPGELSRRAGLVALPAALIAVVLSWSLP